MSARRSRASAPAVLRDLRLARWATSAVFVVNAFAALNVVPRLPEVRDRLGLSDGQLGLAIAGWSGGALVGSLAAGPLVARFGSRRVVLAFGTLLCGAVVLPAVAPSWAALLASYLLLGLADSVMDVAMNAQGLVVQERYGRSVLNSFHGWWSIGSGVAALCGAGAAALGVPLALHLALAGAVGLALLWAAVRVMLPDPPHVDEVGTSHARPPRPSAGLVVRVIGPLVVFGLLATYAEDAPSTWSAIYLTDVVGASPGAAGLGFVAFAVGMTVGRMRADRLVDALGLVRVCMAGGLAAAVGWTIALLGATPAAVYVGLAVAGLGVAPLFPGAMTAAASRPGIPPAYGLAVASWALRLGPLVAPPLVGRLSDAYGLDVALWTVVLAGVGLALSARVLRASPTSTSR